ncbi:MAG: hypothetical protein ACREFY_04875 [Acetobacteraceae bacterium]
MIGTHVWRGGWRGIRRLGRDRRAAIALIAALAAPVVLMSVAVGVEVGHWSAVQIETQRVADMAALAGGQAWAAYSAEQANLTATTTCQTHSQACLAAVAAANVAELNGATGTAGRSWSWNALHTIGTLSDSAVTVVVSTTNANNGLRSSSDPTVQVSVKQAVPLGFAQLFNAAASETLGATAVTEITSTQAWIGPQPCLAALKTAAQGGTGIVYAGYTTVSAIGCSVRSNANITETGSGNWDTDGIYAAGSVTIPNWVSDVNNTGQTVTPQQNAGTIPDPYASDTGVQNALTTAGTVSGSSITCTNQHCGLPNGAPDGTFNGSYCTGQGTGSVTCTLEPGNYGNFEANSGGPYTFDLQPGMYYFNGNISLNNYTTTVGSAVTIVTSGTFSGNNTFNFTITAPTPAQVADTGGIAGLALAGNTTGSVSVSGNPQVQIGGVMYFPNAAFSGQGSTSATGSATASCFEVIAAEITLGGYSGYSGNCPNMGATSFGSTYGSSSSTAALVQ